jgi:ABC-type bacteriocin/lantibiotic exporter with double-glycine peptidase domain
MFIKLFSHYLHITKYKMFVLMLQCSVLSFSILHQRSFYVQLYNTFLTMYVYIYIRIFIIYQMHIRISFYTGLLLASIQNIFYYTDLQQLRDESVVVAIRFVLLGIMCFIGYILQYYCIAQVGQRISTVLRSEMFESLMRRDISFFGT